MNYDVSGGDIGNVSSPSNDKQRRPTEEKSLVPVTIGMVRKSINGVLQDGREPEQVKIIGAVCECANKSTSIEYILEDGTGKISVKEWVENDDKVKQQLSAEASVEHQYIRVIGKIQVYENEMHIIAQHVKKLKDANELAYHMIETVNSLEKYKRSSNIVGSPSMAMSHMQLNPGANLHASKPIGMSYGNENVAEGLQSEIMNFLKKCEFFFCFSERRLSWNSNLTFAFNVTVDESLGGDINVFIANNKQYGESQIRSVVEALSTEGMIYSTVDENHYSAIM